MMWRVFFQLKLLVLITAIPDQKQEYEDYLDEYFEKTFSVETTENCNEIAYYSFDNDDNDEESMNIITDERKVSSNRKMKKNFSLVHKIVKSWCTVSKP